MAVKAGASDAIFTFSNSDHYSGLAFPDINSGTSLTSTFWVYLNNATPFTVWSYDGGGNYIRIRHDGTNWLFDLNGSTTIINTIEVGTWAYFGYTKGGNVHKVYYNSIEKINTTVSITFSFNLFTLRIGAGNAVCAFKMYQTVTSVSANSNLWNANIGSNVSWISYLRRAGDLWDHFFPYANPWTTVHDWSSYPDWTTLGFQSDPSVLETLYCDAWIHPTVGINGVDVSVNPGLLPEGDTYITSSSSFMLQDRNVIPPTATIYGISYFGTRTNSGGLSTTDAWAIYHTPEGTITGHDINGHIGTEPANVLAHISPTYITLYQYSYSAMYRWTCILTTGCGPGATVNLTFVAFNVVYYGAAFPPDDDPGPVITARISQLPIEVLIGASDLSGVYTVDPPASGIPTIRRDVYYNRTGEASTLEKKIPNPTIKTALIGE